MHAAMKQREYKTRQARWQALSDRDAHADGSFVYGVKTTGIYCRANCASRTPNERNVEFFDTVGDAEKAGFRPCRRCRPDTQRVPDHIEEVRKACRFIEQSEEEPSLKQIAQVAGLSPFHFQKLFRSQVGLSPKQYAKAHRLGRLKEALAESPSVTAAIYDAGFGAASRAYDGLSERLGMEPGAYRKGGARQHVHYGFAKTWLGWMLVAATKRGICMIAFDDAKDKLVSHLKKRFSQAEVSHADDGFTEWMQAAACKAEQPHLGTALPLDIQGTAFEERVWQALRQIPPGETLSYSEVAKAIGKPKAVRAVASACAKNPVAVAIPCHRVIGSDGKLHGYRWGLKRKQALLDREKKLPGHSQEK
jgi:AraC family transcriptional regulator of adaptative response/methylated-DNA-[protein]-cysteine methyltransferase